MRALLFALLLLPLVFADNDTIKRTLTLKNSASCPGDILLMNATASDGSPAPDVELRLVLYYPFQGLRALQHTNESGLASVQLTKNGTYRVYINTDEYYTPQYVVFEYPKMCPPPPPKQFDIEAFADCADNLTAIRATANGTPLDNVTITSEKWSSVTGDSGTVHLPLEEGYLFVSAKKPGYLTKEFYVYVTCAPPFECEDDSGCSGNQYCSGGSCINLTGSCGYASNHTWFVHECCSDDACGFRMECRNNTCFAKPSPVTPNITRNDSNATAVPDEEESPPCAFPLAALGIVLLLARK